MKKPPRPGRKASVREVGGILAAVRDESGVTGREDANPRHRLFMSRIFPAFARFSSGLGLAGLLTLPFRSSASEQSPNPKVHSEAPLRTVAHVDLKRYMGDWRVIANIPYFGEKNCVDSIESYALRPDGKIANTFTYRKKSLTAPQKQMHAVAWVKNRQTNAEWNVRFFGLLTVDYLVIDLDPDYRWAVLGYPKRKYGWILAREKTLPDATFKAILRRLAAQGYDVERFQKVPQLPGQMAFLH
jgi:apolipoprotein D and lipocalin family protein